MSQSPGAGIFPGWEAEDIMKSPASSAGAGRTSPVKAEGVCSGGGKSADVLVKFNAVSVRIHSPSADTSVDVVPGGVIVWFGGGHVTVSETEV